jgi:flagellar assembly factor FliW
MPSVQTRDFGEVSYDPPAEVVFPAGVPGFDDQRRFILMAPEAVAPLVVLQSKDNPALAFLAIPVSTVDPEYQSGIGPEDLRLLGFEGQPKPDDALFLAILSPGEGGSLTANLLAPIVINKQTRTAVQAVRSDRRYSHQSPVPRELLERPCS